MANLILPRRYAAQRLGNVVQHGLHAESTKNLSVTLSRPAARGNLLVAIVVNGQGADTGHTFTAGFIEIVEDSQPSGAWWYYGYKVAVGGEQTFTSDWVNSSASHSSLRMIEFLWDGSPPNVVSDVDLITDSSATRSEVEMLARPTLRGADNFALAWMGTDSNKRNYNGKQWSPWWPVLYDIGNNDLAESRVVRRFNVVGPVRAKHIDVDSGDQIAGALSIFQSTKRKVALYALPSGGGSVLAGSVSEAVTLSNTQTAAATAAAAASEALTAASVENSAFVGPGDVAEPGTLASAESGVQAQLGSLTSDATLASAESLSRISDVSASEDATQTSAESSAIEQNVSKTSAATFTSSESGATAGAIEGSLTEAVTLASTEGSQLVAVGDVSEPVTAGVTIVSGGVFTVSLAQDLITGDTHSGGLDISVAIAAENATLADVAGGDTAIIGSMSEALSPADQASALLGALGNVSEPVAVTDFYSTVHVAIASAVEAVVIAALEDANGSFTVDLTDGSTHTFVASAILDSDIFRITGNVKIANGTPVVTLVSATLQTTISDA